VASQVWDAVADGGVTDFLVVLAEQADLSAAVSQPSREARLRCVYDALRDVAVRAQAPLRVELDESGVDYRAFYIVNMLAVRGDRDLVTRIAARPEVARIAANPRARQVWPQPQVDGVRSLASQGVEWGVARVRAPDVWALGYIGQGVVVAGQDTGYDWDHPALIRQYRGYSGDGVAATHDYHWHDAIHTSGGVCGADSAIPCDDNSHGTHTMGTMVGDDGAGNQIGVAPGARWIGCRNMDEGVGTPAAYAECFEFFLAPYPIRGDPFTDGVPALAPHVVNNSWTCPPSEGCDWATLQAVVENTRAGGILVVAAAGNSGPSCSTVRDPPAIYDAVFTAGATDLADLATSFSSRGPVMVDGSGRPKPDVAAPGFAIWSSLPGGWYGYKQGTSMAAPHVVGAVALLYSAAPDLVGDVEAAEWFITHTARPHTTTQTCGGDVPNHVYGWGIVDALAAVRAALPPLEVVKTASSETVQPGVALTYTLRVANTGALTLTAIVLTDVTPLGTTFARADGGWAAPTTGTVDLGWTVVTWTVDSLSSGGRLTATLAVTVGELGPGTRVVNDAYQVRAAELLSPVIGTPVEVWVPWQVTLPLVLRGWGVEHEEVR